MPISKRFSRKRLSTKTRLDPDGYFDVDNELKPLIKRARELDAIPTLAQVVESNRFMKTNRANSSIANISFFRDYSLCPELNPMGGPRINLVRSSGGTRINQKGFVELVGNNIPRFDYDPATKVCKGLLAEEARTNLLIRSAEFDNAVWQSATADLTITPNVAISPSGEMDADLVTNGAIPSTTRLRQNVTLSATTYTTSVWVRVASGTQWIRLLIFDGTTSFASWTLITTNWQRIALTATTAAGSGGILIAAVIGDGSSSYSPSAQFYLWGGQLEVGSFATSYIPTTTATVTRSADLITITQNDLNALFGQSEGALYVESRRFANSSTGTLFDINDTTAGNRIRCERIATTDISSFTSSSGITANTANSVTYTNNAKVVLTYLNAFSNISICMNAGVVASASGTGLLNMTQITIGHNVTNTLHLNGTISRLVIYNKSFSNAVLQNLTG